MVVVCNSTPNINRTNKRHFILFYEKEGLGLEIDSTKTGPYALSWSIKLVIDLTTLHGFKDIHCASRQHFSTQIPML